MMETLSGLKRRLRTVHQAVESSHTSDLILLTNWFHLTHSSSNEAMHGKPRLAVLYALCSIPPLRVLCGWSLLIPLGATALVILGPISGVSTQ